MGSGETAVGGVLVGSGVGGVFATGREVTGLACGANSTKRVVSPLPYLAKPAPN